VTACTNARVDRPVVGFRAWAVNWYGATAPSLMATTVNVAWDPTGVNEALCLFEATPPPALRAWGRHILGLPAEPAPRHAAPAANCMCGLYAYDSLESARAYACSAQWEFAWRPGPNNLMVLGAVLVWGEGARPVRIGDTTHDTGPTLRYRSPFARVLALLGPEREDDAAYEVGAALGLPVLPARGLEPYAREHGTQLRAEEVGR